jgi:hypothetical protein
MKKQKKIRRRIKEIQTKDVYSGERSPYWEFAQAHQRTEEDGTVTEDVFANPDMLSEDDTVFHPRMTAEGEFKLRGSTCVKRLVSAAKASVTTVRYRRHDRG